MNILLVEDDPRHREAAFEQFAEDNCDFQESYVAAFNALKDDHNYDLALFDLLLPAEDQTLGSEGMKYFGQQAPIGLVLALRAAMVGVPQIIVITDANHHCHPMSAALDWISPSYWSTDRQSVIRIGESQVLIGHAPFDDQGRKNWRAALTVLEKRQ